MDGWIPRAACGIHRGSAADCPGRKSATPCLAAGCGGSIVEPSVSRGDGPALGVLLPQDVSGAYSTATSPIHSWPVGYAADRQCARWPCRDSILDGAVTRGAESED